MRKKIKQIKLKWLFYVLSFVIFLKLFLGFIVLAPKIVNYISFKRIWSNSYLKISLKRTCDYFIWRTNTLFYVKQGILTLFQIVGTNIHKQLKQRLTKKLRLYNFCILARFPLVKGMTGPHSMNFFQSFLHQSRCFPWSAPQLMVGLFLTEKQPPTLWKMKSSSRIWFLEKSQVLQIIINFMCLTFKTKLEKIWIVYSLCLNWERV